MEPQRQLTTVTFSNNEEAMQAEEPRKPIEKPAEAQESSTTNAGEDPQKVAPKRCANCGTERIGRYCYDCGQLFLDGRLSFGRLWSEFAARFFNVERGFWRTLRELLLDPGGVARRYVEGQRRRYTNPLSYFLFAAAVSLLTFTLVDQVMIDEMARMLAADFGDDESMRVLFGPDPAQGYAEFVVRSIKQYNTYLAIFLCIPFALFLRLFFARFNFTEHAVFALYALGQATFITGLLTPLGFVTTSSFLSVMTLFVQAAICGWAARGFYERNFTSVLLALVAFALSQFLFWMIVAIVLICVVIFGI